MCLLQKRFISFMSKLVFFKFILKMGCQNFLLMLIDAVVEFYSISSKLVQFQQGNFL